MPLSQGCNAKGVLSTKRGSFKPMRTQCSRDDSKRSKLNENVLHPHSHQCHQLHELSPQQQHHHNHHNTQQSHSFKTLNSHAYPTHIAPQCRLYDGAITCASISPPPLKAKTSAANSLQLSFLVGESLARCGRLPEAFDIYAIIASDHYDGLVPLDRLHTLATSLIDYVRQSSSGGRLEEAAIIATENGKCTNFGPPESTIKLRYSVWHNSNANTHPANGSSTTTVPDALLEADDLADLHAPTRELGGISRNPMRITSPTLSDNYDPLMCPLCHDILRCPVTTNCGHTFCRQCCETITMCHICHIKFPRLHLDESVPIYDQGSGMVAGTPTIPTEPQPSATFLATNDVITTGSVATPWLGFLASNASSSSSSIPITTTTVASTTATTTTTMASTSPLEAAIVGSTGSTAYSTRHSISTGSSPISATVSGGVSTANNMKFMPDVLVRRLVEKWWGPDLQAKKINETAASYMHLNLLDDALKFCNASLEKSPSNFKSLLLRAEVLRKLNHYQSSLADVENALKTRYTSARAHYLRALTLSELGRFDEALFDNCLAISLDKSANLTTSELFQHDLTKNLQKLMAHSSKSKTFAAAHRTFVSTAPYSILPEQRWRRKQISLLSNANGDHYSSSTFDEMAAAEAAESELFVPYVGKQWSIADDEAVILSDSISGMEMTERERVAYMADIVGKVYDMPLKRQTSRKHFRRKWLTNSNAADLMMLDDRSTLDEFRSSAQFCNILERIQQELVRLKKLEASGECAEKQLVQVTSNLIDASDFDCVLCCRTFWKPVVTPCGHTYCLVCLDRCMDYTSSCPLCMSPLVEPHMAGSILQGSVSPVPFVLAKRPVTKFLEAAMKRFIPDSYEKRFRQEIDMEPSVPVFICTTAFPYVPCPLFVYEPRYRLMVRRAVESGEKQFGIVQPHSGKSRYFDVGTILDIRDCVLLGDGCSILSTIGWKRFKILARNEKDGYETAKVEYIYDETIADESVPYVSNMHAAVLTKAIDWFDSLRTELKQEILQSFGAMPRVEDNWETIPDGPAWAWWIIALLPLSQQLKVDILATTSLEKRLRAIEKTLDYITFRRAQQECSVVVVQQQQHQHQQHQQQQQQQLQQQQQCDNAELSHQTDECCLRTTSNAINGDADDPHIPNRANSDHSQHLLL